MSDYGDLRARIRCRRKIAGMVNTNRKNSPAFNSSSTDREHGVRVFDVESKKGKGRGKKAMATVGIANAGGLSNNPAWQVAKAISEALAPSTAPGKVTSWKDMTPEECAEMTRLYGKKG